MPRFYPRMIIIKYLLKKSTVHRTMIGFSGPCLMTLKKPEHLQMSGRKESMHCHRHEAMQVPKKPSGFIVAESTMGTPFLPRLRTVDELHLVSLQ
jgi:hypothetical protein